jgi:hypothetical protein
MTAAEERFAQALLAIEPEKVEGGSQARRDWLGLVLHIQQYLHEHGFDMDTFMRALLEEETGAAS